MNGLLFLNVDAPEIILLLFIVSFPLILTIYCLLDITRSSFQDPTNKIIWAIIILLAPVIGALAYLIWGRQQKSTAS
ncbi:hypothetical protein GZH53_11645 [Flavihumibacter sp. R14]|nr:hypothetical protein [Flavihumibacter soli]